MGKLGQFSQGLDPGPAQGLTWASPGLDPGQPRSIFWSRFWSNRTTETTAFTATPKGRARPFIVSVPAVVSVVLFDQNLDQKIDLGWPGSSPGLAQVKPWAGPGSSPWENWANFPKGFPKIPPYEKLGLSFLGRCMLVQPVWLVPFGPR